MIIGILCHLSGMSDKTIRGEPIIRAESTMAKEIRLSNRRPLVWEYRC